MSFLLVCTLTGCNLSPKEKKTNVNIKFLSFVKFLTYSQTIYSFVLILAHLSSLGSISLLVKLAPIAGKMTVNVSS